MSNDDSPHNDNRGLAALAVAGIVGFAAGMIWYNLFADNTRRKKLFKKMKRYDNRLVRSMI